MNKGLGASVGNYGQEPTCRNLQGVPHVRVRALIIVRVPKHNSPGETRTSLPVEGKRKGWFGGGVLDGDWMPYGVPLDAGRDNAEGRVRGASRGQPGPRAGVRRG